MPYSKHVKFAVCVGAKLTALGAGCLPACAQVLYGAIVGTAVDQGSSAIPEATVKITSVGTSQSREALTDASGNFPFASVPGAPTMLPSLSRGSRPTQFAGSVSMRMQPYA
jgi:hypothetical protein